MNTSAKFKTTDEYIAEFSKEIKAKLEEIRKIIKEAAPDSEEVISYNMPAFKYKKRILVYFSGTKNHVGFYPTGAPIEEFKDRLTKYKTSKGTIQFPYNMDFDESLLRIL